ncbi:peptidase C26 [Clostridium carnis]|uniref:Peptidase C26 n=1 Tax=Clostridium carnis TaxID=1530 RepID=A0ABY6SV28_9CLOT|nr:gamma-glutamyl-gamma-aminobutyrate hydrolase family protein [Clostridium carnis]VDG72432.1 peptidase C26 [Clostridium carnis]
MKKIFVTQRVEVIEGYDERRDSLDQNWINLLIESGFLGIIIPNNIEYVKLLLKEHRPDGILLTGGNNLFKYGGNAPERDIVENYLIKYAINNNIPLVGVCRGMQIILDYFNNELIQVKNHVKRVHRVVGRNGFKYVNSYHDFGIKGKLNDFEILYKSDDYVIEEIKHKKYSIYGMMHHPERNTIFNRADIDFLKKIY